MAITQLPTPPNRHRPNLFAEEANVFLSALPNFGSEANDLASEVNALRDTVVIKEGLLHPHYDNIDAVGENIVNVNAVASNETNINAVVANSTNINTVSANIASTVTVATKIQDISSVAGNQVNINIVATNTSRITSVAQNMSDINAAEANADIATQKAAEAAEHEAQAQEIIDNISVAPLWVSGEDYVKYQVVTDPTNFKTYKATVAVPNSTVEPHNDANWWDVSWGGTANFSVTEIVATAGQTTFSADYTVGLVDIFLNGVRLNSSEVNISSGTSIVLANPAEGGDILTVHSFGVFSVANTYTKSEVDTTIRELDDRVSDANAKSTAAAAASVGLAIVFGG